MKKKYMFVSISVLMVLVLGLSGCDTVNRQVEQNDDKEFIAWVTSDMNHQTMMMNAVTEALDDKDYYGLETTGEESEDYVDSVSKPRCNSFDVSSKYTLAQSEYYAYLGDISYMFFYTKWAGKEMQSGSYTQATESFEDCTSYAEKAQVHLRIVNSIINS